MIFSLFSTTKTSKDSKRVCSKLSMTVPAFGAKITALLNPVYKTETGTTTQIKNFSKYD